MNKTFQKIVSRPQTTDSSGVVDLLDDLIVFCDARGKVVSGNSKASPWLERENARGRFVWELFKLEGGASVSGFLETFDMDRTYEIRSEQENGIYSMRIVGLPEAVAPSGGYVVIATDVRPLLDMREEIEEQFEDLSTRISLEEDLQQREAEMEDLSIALKQVIRTVEEEKQEFKDELAQQVREQVLPFLERIADEECSDVRMSYKTAIRDQIAEFVDGSSEKFDSVMFKLTPREIEICKLIQLGRRGKEIAEMLSISFETLQTHRKNIRRKLKIKGKGVSLYSFLLQNNELGESRVT